MCPFSHLTLRSEGVEMGLGEGWKEGGAVYLGISCEVKVGDEYSDSFEVTTGLQ